VRIVGSKRGPLAWHALQMYGAILFVMMPAIPAFTQSATKADSHNHQVTRGMRLGVDVTVVDPSNAVIRKANVTLSPGKDTIANAASTDSRGVSRFRRLSKGTYEIIVQAPGFRTVQQTVTVKKMERVRVKLQIAVRIETVEVTAAPVVVDTIVNLTAEPLPYIPYIQFPLNLTHLAVL
jgi:hypothetical protein